MPEVGQEGFLEEASIEDYSQDQIYALFAKGVDADSIIKNRKLGWESGSNEHSPAYGATNEELSLFDGVDHHGKRVLAILGSMDYPLYAALKGAREVVGVDSTPTACLFAELKLAAIKHMDYEQFITFWGFKRGSGDKAFSAAEYAQLRPGLSQLAQAFFDKVIVDDSVKEKAQDFIIGFGERALKRIPHFKDSEAYDETKRAVSSCKFVFVPANISDYVGLSYADRFDIAYLSNVLSRSDDDGKQLAQQCSQKLEPGGKILAVYSREKKQKDLPLDGLVDTEKVSLDPPNSPMPFRHAQIFSFE